MSPAAPFAAPEPVAVRVRSELSRAEVMVRLERAIAERMYSTPGRNSPSFLRLGGSVAEENVILTARPYVIPGVISGYGAMTIELRGEIAPTDGGSEVRGFVTAPVKWTPLDILLVGLFAVLVVWGIVSEPRHAAAHDPVYLGHRPSPGGRMDLDDSAQPADGPAQCRQIGTDDWLDRFGFARSSPGRPPRSRPVRC